MTRVIEYLAFPAFGLGSYSFRGVWEQDYLLAFRELTVKNSLFASLSDGDHSIVGSAAVSGVSSILNFGNGSSNVWLTGPNAWQEVRITGGAGDHAILVDQVGAYGAQVRLGDGNSVVELGTQSGDVRSNVIGGHGDFRVKANDLAKVTLGNGDHIVNVGEAQAITVGNGNSSISFTAGTDNYGTNIKAGNGNHTIIGDSVASKTATYVQVGNATDDGGSLIQLDGAYGFLNVTGGIGAHKVQIGEVTSASISLGGWDMRDHGHDMVLQIDKITSQYGTNIKLSGGDHLIDIGTRVDDRGTYISAGDGDSRVIVNGAASIRLGHGDHVVDAGEVGRIQTGSGAQQIFFEDGRDYVSANIHTSGSGDDIVVGLSEGSKSKAYINTHSGDDTIALLDGAWNYSFINGGSGYDTLYIDERSAGKVMLFGIEEVVYLSAELTAEEALDLIGLTRPEVGISADEELNLVRDDFELTPLPDEQSAAGAKVGFVDLPDTETATDAGALTREGRLMENDADFFLRVDAYELSYANETFTTSYQTVRFNDFGDLCGTNDSDNVVDTSGDSQIFAMAGNDVIEGQDGQDRIYAGQGDDVLFGGAGQDLLDGGAGYDILNGGEGIDIFVFRKGEGTTEIEDFELSYDILDVEGFDNLTYQDLTDAGRQDGNDVVYELGGDILILRDTELATMIEIDLCMR